MVRVDPVRWLLHHATSGRLQDLPGLANQAAPLLDAVEIVCYVVDYAQTHLVPLLGPGVPGTPG